jgi:excisionase family DNA binding protein
MATADKEQNIMSTFASSQPLLTITETAKLFNIGRQSVARWIHDGSLRAIKIGGSVRIRVEDVDAFISDNERKRNNQMNAAMAQ